MKRIVFGISILCLGLSFTHCDKDDDAKTNPSITLTVNGTSKNVVAGSAVLAFEEQYDHEGRSIAIAGTVDGSNTFIISVSNWDFQNPPPDGIKVKTYNNVFGEDGVSGAECLELSGSSTVLCDGGLVTYSTSTETYMSALYEGELEGFIKITSCNTSSKQIFGEYDIMVDNGDGDELALKGKFENITYIVVK